MMTTTASEDALLRKKRYTFHARRGMKEVEEVLFDYLERYYDQDDESMQLLFGRLLDCQDVDMFEWFLHRTLPEDADLADYVRQLIARVETR